MLYIQDQLDFLLYERGTSITVNGVVTTAVIEFTSKVDIEEVSLITATLIKRGDLIVIKGRHYFLDQEINISHFDTYYKAMAQSCNYSINFIVNNAPMNFDAIVSSKAFDITTTQMLMLPVGKLMVTIQNNNYSNQIILGDRFIKMGFAWKVTGMDRSHTNLIILTCDMFPTIQGDDMNNEIPYYVANSSHTYVVSATPTSASIVLSATQQLTTSVTDKAVLVSNPTFTYSSNAPTIATVSSTGLITAIALGSATIVVSFLGLDGVTYSKTVAETSINSVARTFSISGASPIPVGADKVYSIIDGATSQLITDLTFTYVSANLTNGTISSSTSNTFTFHPINNSQVKVTATSGSYSCFKVISISGSF